MGLRNSASGWSLPASPTLRDLADPEWVTAYRAAGGNVRPARSGVSGSGGQPYLVGPVVEPLTRPRPSFFRGAQRPELPKIKTDEALVAEAVEDLGQLVAGTVRPIPQVAPPKPPDPDPQPDQVISAMQERTSAWLSIFCPGARAALDGARRAILRDEVESGAHAATSLRRALACLADAVEPPGVEGKEDHTGTLRQVRQSHYKNRLYVYLGHKLSGSARKLALLELESADRRLTSLLDALGKAVHSESSRADLEQLYVTCWSVVARTVGCAEAPA
jgi:hypothetical protein